MYHDYPDDGHESIKMYVINFNGNIRMFHDYKKFYYLIPCKHVRAPSAGLCVLRIVRPLVRTENESSTSDHKPEIKQMFIIKINYLIQIYNTFDSSDNFNIFFSKYCINAMTV